MKSTKTSQRQKGYVKIQAEKNAQNHFDHDHNEQFHTTDIQEKINSSIFTLNPRQYWAGPHFFFNTLQSKKK